MDTSEEYIKMCQKAKEIQINWKPQKGDLVYNYEGEDNNVRLIVSYYDFTKLKLIVLYRGDAGWSVTGGYTMKSVDEVCKSNVVFLPRQDQLQELFKDGWGCHLTLELFKEWAFIEHLDPCDEGYSKESDYIFSFKSMEQLWLAFVMKEKHNKIWHKGEWKYTKAV